MGTPRELIQAAAAAEVARHHNRQTLLWLGVSAVGYAIALGITVSTWNAWIIIAFTYGSWTAYQVEQHSRATAAALRNADALIAAVDDRYR